MKIAKSASTLAWIARVAHSLGHLRQRCLFLGGAIVELLITDAAAYSPRPTDDVDVILELATSSDAKLILDLRDLGFREDTSDEAPRCRWLIEQLKVDIVPITPDAAGINHWYREAIASGCPVQLPNCPEINLIRAPLFIATKIAAFRDRGHGDFQASHDIEDIIAVIDGRQELFAEIQESSAGVREYLSQEVRSFLASGQFLDWLPGHLPGDEASQARIPKIQTLLRKVAALT